jgi:hypothetical protein
MKNYIFFLIRVKNTRCQNQKYCFKKKKKKRTYLFFSSSSSSSFFVFFLPNTYKIYLYETHAEPTRRPLRTGRPEFGEIERDTETERYRERERASKRR